MEDPTTRLKKLVQKANEFDIDYKIPAARYLRSSSEMERMALVYASEHENENGFLLYMKLITLLVEKLPKHPLFKSLTPEQKKIIKTRCQTAFFAAEKLKKCVKDQFENEYTIWQLNEAKRKKEEEELKKRACNLSLRSPEVIPSAPTLIDTADFVERKEPTAPLATDIPIGTQLWGTSSPTTQTTLHPTTTHLAEGNAKHISSTIQNHKPFVPPDTSQNRNVQPVAPPADSTSRLPPSYHEAVSYQPTPQYQPPSPNPQFDRSAKPAVFNPTTEIPQVNRNVKPQGYISRQVSDSLDGNRRIVIPADLVPRFLQAVTANTQRNLETCGILNGTLSQNTLRVTHLVIPKQTATPDSCTTECEEELFEVQDKYDTITLGWIHTHPSQTAFLSSVDLHTQCSYQQLMPEAIAIVCAPKYNTTGMYRLTPNHGLQFIASCNKQGFHPHPKDPALFEESPLVATDSNARIQMVDLR